MGFFHVFYGIADGFLKEWLEAKRLDVFYKHAHTFAKNANRKQLYIGGWGEWVWNPNWKVVQKKYPDIGLALHGKTVTAFLGREPLDAATLTPQKRQKLEGYSLLRAADLKKLLPKLERIDVDWVLKLKEFYRRMEQDENGVLILPPRKYEKSPMC